MRFFNTALIGMLVLLFLSAVAFSLTRDDAVWGVGATIAALWVLVFGCLSGRYDKQSPASKISES